MMRKSWCCLEEVPYCFPSHPSNFKVTRLIKSPILTQIGRFRTVAPVRIHRWIWNDAQSLMLRRGALLFFKVIRQIPMSHGPKKSSILTQIGRPVWIHQRLWNDAQSLMQPSNGALLFSNVIHQISRSHGTKYCQFRPELSVSGL